MCGVIVLVGALVTPSRGNCQEANGLTLERAVALALELDLDLGQEVPR